MKTDLTYTTFMPPTGSKVCRFTHSETKLTLCVTQRHAMAAFGKWKNNWTHSVPGDKMEKAGQFHSAAVLTTGKWMFSRAGMDVLENNKPCVSAETRISIPRRPSSSTNIYIDWIIPA